MEDRVLQDVLHRAWAATRHPGLCVVGIDGAGAAGKTSLAITLAAASTTPAVVVRFDDFYLPKARRAPLVHGHPPEPNFDWQRLRCEVLLPLSEGRPARYQRYDWDDDVLAEWNDVPAEGLVVIEGVYVTRSQLRSFYDFRIWVQTPRDVRLDRAVARDGEDARGQWEDEWMPAEDEYIARENPAASADWIFDAGANRDSRPRAKAFGC
jgi:uridine kinase